MPRHLHLILPDPCLIVSTCQGDPPRGRLGIGSSVIFSYPFAFVGLRDGVLTLLNLDPEIARVQRVATGLLIVLVNGAALVLKDLGLVNALGGAVFGSTLVFICPAAMFVRHVGRTPRAGTRVEVALNAAIIGAGVFFAAVGTVVSLAKSYSS